MARIELHNYEIWISDGAGNHFMMTDRPVRWKPKTKRQYEKLCQRVNRIGGRRRTARQRMKYNRAMRGKLAYEGMVAVCDPGSSDIEWTESAPSISAPEDPIEVEFTIERENDGQNRCSRCSRGPDSLHGTGGQEI